MAFLYAQLENIQQVIKQRKKVASYYDIHLQPLAERGLLSLPKFLSYNSVNYHLYAILCRNELERSELIAHLKTYDISAVFHYIPLHSSPAGKKFGRTTGDDLPVTDMISRTLLRLPVYYDITIEEQSRVVSVLNSFFQKT